MSAVELLALALGAAIVLAFVVVLVAAVGHAAYLIDQERKAKGIELEPTPTRGRLGIQTSRPRRGEHRPRP